MRYTINLIGTTWNGFESAYVYHATQPAIPTEAEIRSKAGDFEYVYDWQIISTETTVVMESESTTVITHRETIVHPWFYDESAYTFEDAMVQHD